jgi:uncharacterized protein YbjT (DUF2867 family)
MQADTILVTGATGFIGKALVSALKARGLKVAGASRQPLTATDVDWRVCDLLRPETLPAALSGVRAAYYLVHSMGGRTTRFRELESRAAHAFATAAAAMGLERVIYLGGPAPNRHPSEHLASRLKVGEILRAGPVPTVELRASMVIGAGGASWQIVRDLALRLPFMVLPAWLASRTRPVALDDVLIALSAALDLPLERSAWFDIPGPDTLSGRQILERIAALEGRRIPVLNVPLLTPRLSALWLKLVTGADFALARELVLGLTQDLLPRDDRYWRLIGHTSLVPFDEAARRALASEPRRGRMKERLARAEERLVARVGPHRRDDGARTSPPR